MLNAPDISLMNVLITNDGYKGRGIYIGRPSIFGNPYPTKKSKLSIEKVYKLDESLAKYEEYLNALPSSTLLSMYNTLNKLDFVTLDCFCIFQRFQDIADSEPCKCHGQVLIRTLNNHFG